METILAVCAGIALAAACGFRVFLPLLAASMAVHYGYLQPSAGMNWLGSTPAMTLLGVATVVEIAGYYIPWVDHALDTIATPAALVAGAVVAAAAFGDINPAVKWTAALIAGGAAAGAVQGTTVLSRAASTAMTGGLGNPIVATLEAIVAVIISILAIVVPVLALGLMLIICLVLFRWYRRKRASRVPIPAGNQAT